MIKPISIKINKNLDKKFYKENYLNLGKSAKKIAEEIDCDAQTVLNRLHMFKIKIRDKKLAIVKTGKENPMWKECPSMSALHEWVSKHKPKPKICEDCKKNKFLELANISNKYKRDIMDYKYLCRKCHLIMDFKSGVRKPYIRGSSGYSSARPVCGSAEYGPARRG